MNENQNTTAPADKPKRVNRKTREALAAEFQRGYEDGARDGGPDPVGLMLVAGFIGTVFFGIGAWLF